MRLPLALSVGLALSSNACVQSPVELQPGPPCDAANRPSTAQFEADEQGRRIRVFPPFQDGCGAYQTSLELDAAASSLRETSVYCNRCSKPASIDVYNEDYLKVDGLVSLTLLLSSEISFVDHEGVQYTPTCLGSCSTNINWTHRFLPQRLVLEAGQSIQTEHSYGFEVLAGGFAGTFPTKDWRMDRERPMSAVANWPRLDDAPPPLELDRALQMITLCRAEGLDYPQALDSNLQLSELLPFDDLFVRQDLGSLELPDDVRAQVRALEIAACAP